MARIIPAIDTAIDGALAWIAQTDTKQAAPQNRLRPCSFGGPFPTLPEPREEEPLWVFDGVVFLFCFMPLALGLYYLVPGRVKNAVLLVESLLFFCWVRHYMAAAGRGRGCHQLCGGASALPACPPAGGERKIVLIAAIVLNGRRRWSTANTRTFCWTRSTLSLPPGLPS